jgi:hypothetical protein
MRSRCWAAGVEDCYNDGKSTVRCAGRNCALWVCAKHVAHVCRFADRTAPIIDEEAEALRAPPDEYAKGFAAGYVKGKSDAIAKVIEAVAKTFGSWCKELLDKIYTDG